MKTPNRPHKFVCLLVLDGWGIAPQGPGNAVTLARTVNMDRFWASFPHAQLLASGRAVGLPRKEAGNSETGHLNLGAGRIVYQDLERINMSIADGSFFKNPILIEAIEHAKKNNSHLHYLGLIGAGGVHSNIEHLFALINLAKERGCKRVFLHLFTDGRDSPPTAAKTYIARLREVIKKEGIGEIASIIGRYWAMDRDRRWERTAKAYFALTQGQGRLVKTPEEAIDFSYAEGQTDEFIEPSLMCDSQGNPLALIKDNDAVVFLNFRIDRPRQLTAAFIVKDFSIGSLELDFDPFLEKYKKTSIPSKGKALPIFKRGKLLENLYFATMTEYSRSLIKAGAKVAIQPERIDLPLGRVVADANLRQLRATESEKERFVTYYFNGQRENPFPGEDRLIVPSPKVATYDLQPEMSAVELTNKLLERLKSLEYSFILVNYPNPDMVGHTGSIGPAVKACEITDECLGKIAHFVLGYQGVLLITADHGNVEEMINSQTGEIDTEHSDNPVPFIAVSQQFLGRPQTLATGILADIAPTVLKLLSLKAPLSMTGRNLLQGIWQT